MIMSLVVSIIVVFIILYLSIVTINKGYSYKHTVDKVDELPDLSKTEEKVKEE